MMKIYTKSGDKGSTSLVYGKRVSKMDARVQAYGTCDEANSMIGFALSRLTEGKLPDEKEFIDVFHKIQTILFHVGAELATPSGKKVHWEVSEEDVFFLERIIDKWNDTLPPIKKFILPGGSETGAALHVARTITRRGERNAVEVGDGVKPAVLSYLNRLSDFLFVAARYVNYHLGEQEPVLHDDPSK